MALVAEGCARDAMVCAHNKLKEANYMCNKYQDVDLQKFAQWTDHANRLLRTFQQAERTWIEASSDFRTMGDVAVWWRWR
jgi:aspartate-semialdehyde dehydrogenase